MRVVKLTDPEEFRSRTEALLLEDEARHNLMLGLNNTLITRPSVYEEFRLWVVEDDDRPVMAALQTPPYNLTISRPHAEGALDELAEALQGEAGIPGLVAALPEADEFSRAWAELTGCRTRTVFRQGIYRLSTVSEGAAVPGAMQEAGPADRDLLVRWARAFEEEAVPSDRPGSAERMVDTHLAGASSGLVFWEDGHPVSLAGFGGRTPNGIRIGPVYTPPEARGRGYASALVAGLSQRLLDEGLVFCFLYTDLSNPTSNRIYRRIGYEQVCESVEYRFDKPHEDRSEPGGRRI